VQSAAIADPEQAQLAAIAPRWRLAVAVLLLLFSALLQARPALTLSGNEGEIDLAAHVLVLEDPEGLWGVDEVRSAAIAARFRPLPGSTASFGFSHSAWWLSVELRNGSPTTQTPILRQSYPLLDHLEVWVLQGGRIVQHWQTGDRLPFSTRPIEHRDFLFPLELASGAGQTLLLRASSQGPVNVPLSLYQPTTLLSRIAAEQLALGSLYGSIVLLATCVLVLFLFVRDLSFLYYLLYVLSYGTYMAAFNGIAYQYLLPNAPELASVLQVLLLMAALFFLLQFARSILRVASAAPRIDRVTRYLQMFILGVLVAAPFFSYATLIRPISLVTTLSMLLVISMGVASHRAGQPTARYFLLAWSAFLVGVLLYMMKSFGLLPHNFVTQYGFQIGTMLEFVLLSLALGVRVQEIKQQSRTDSLSGLGNRAHFDEQLAELFAASSAGGAPLSLLVIDIDQFKRVNDQHGHAIGDRVLQRVAGFVRRTPPQSGLACRYGGEEFVVLLPRTALDTAEQSAEQLRREIAADDREPRVTVSVGVASTASRSCASPRDLFRAADEALYAAKRSGRNRVVAEDGRDRRQGESRLSASGAAQA